MAAPDYQDNAMQQLIYLFSHGEKLTKDDFAYIFSHAQCQEEAAYPLRRLFVDVIVDLKAMDDLENFWLRMRNTTDSWETSYFVNNVLRKVGEGGLSALGPHEKYMVGS